MSLHYYPLINKVITTLNLRDKLAFGSHPNPDEAFRRPFITIAREPGSGGAPIARAVAEKLHFTCIDEQIIEEIAKSTKKRKEVIKAVDEKGRTAIQDIVHSLLNVDYVDDIKYVRELVKVVLTYAHQGHVVILGRGANFITPFAKGLHVNITAPYSVRVQRAMEFEGHTLDIAKDVIAENEQERKVFIKQYLKKDSSKCNAYDMTLNTTYFTVEQARDVIIEAFYRKFPRAVRYGAMFGK
ncbi:MAG: cytidylate kinase-like family protein [bacterium]|nr:cytidylate kinase-like family protein [bacterium]